jgi:DNA topoisomerase-2
MGMWYLNMIIDPRDKPLYTYLKEEGKTIQPHRFYTLLPMFLVNGAFGIATGWSTRIPSYSPLEIISWIKAWIMETLHGLRDSPLKIAKYPNLVPWYRGYFGKIRMTKKSAIYTGLFQSEAYEFKGKKLYNVRVYELPIGKWMEPYKVFLENLVKDKQLGDFKQYCTDNNADYQLTGLTFEPTDKSLKLIAKESISNFVLLDNNDKPHHYQTVDDMLNSWCAWRHEGYIRRKENLLSTLTSDIEKLKNKEKFVRAVKSGEIDLRDSEKVNIEKMNAIGIINDKDHDLLGMKIRTVGKERADKLLSDVFMMELTKSQIEAKSPLQMQLDDLAIFEAEYLKVYGPDIRPEHQLIV